MSKYVFIYSLQINIFEKINYFTKLKKKTRNKENGASFQRFLQIS